MTGGSAKAWRKNGVRTKFQIGWILTALWLGGLGASHLLTAAKPSPPAIRHVLLISVDGLHALDLANFIKSEPKSALAQLSGMGVTYTQAFTSKPSNSFPGLIGMLTGGSPTSTGIWYEGTYARSLSPPGSNCATKGTEVVWDSSIDKDRKAVDGGGIDPSKLPLDPAKGCVAVYPHNYLRVNTIFEVVHGAGMRTAWCDKHPSYEMVKGPSGRGVDDLFTPELAASGANRDLQAAKAFDDLKVRAVLNEIDGKDSTGLKPAPVPAHFGLSLQQISVAQKMASGGYSDGAGTPSAALLEALRHADQSIGELLQALRTRGLADATLIIVTAKHGESPIDPRIHRIIPDSILLGIINQTHPGVLGLAYQDGDIASIWLKDQSQTSAVVRTLNLPQNQSAAHIQEVLSGESLKLMFNDPLQDDRIPDIVLIPHLGGIYLEEDSKFISEHGGFNDQDTNVALIVANPRLSARVIKTPVQTTQIAPTILKALGLNASALQAVQREGTSVLPGGPLDSPPSAPKRARAPGGSAFR